MYVLDPRSIATWDAVGNVWQPRGVNTHCPYCAERGTFSPYQAQYFQEFITSLLAAHCPTCTQNVLFFVVGPGPSDDRSQMRCQCLAMWPAPRMPRYPAAGFALLPEEIRLEYSDTLQVFNAKVWSATTATCRRLLEAIVEDLNPTSDKKILFERLEELSHIELSEPVRKLTDLLRKGGNVGAHFDPRKRPNKDTAEGMLRLTEYLIEYLYRLPGLVDELEKHLEQLGQNESPESAE